MYPMAGNKKLSQNIVWQHCSPVMAGGRLVQNNIASITVFLSCTIFLDGKKRHICNSHIESLFINAGSNL